MIVGTIISDHLVLIRHVTGFCLRLGFDMLNKVILKLVAISPGSMMAKVELALLSTDGTPGIHTAGQATVISPVVTLQPLSTMRVIEFASLMLSGLLSRRILNKRIGVLK